MGWLPFADRAMTPEELRDWCVALVKEKLPTTSDAMAHSFAKHIEPRFLKGLQLNNGDYKRTKDELRKAYLGA